MRGDFFKDGWCHFPHDTVLMSWITENLPTARTAVTDPVNADWIRCSGTWFVGVNAIPNDDRGAVNGGSPIAGQAVDFIHQTLGLNTIKWDRAQLSICYPGYPQRSENETDAAYRFRHKFDAAHVDGLHAEGPGRRRHLREYHGFLLGLPMVTASPDAAPFVIWEGSHKIMRAGFKQILKDTPPEDWGNVDMTKDYQAIRREALRQSNRIEISAKPGEAYVIHRHALHGMAPWGESATAGPDGRMIAYFRPELEQAIDWLNTP